MSKMIAFVIPACNEQSNVIVIARAINNIMAPLKYDYRILFVDDGSTDDTLAVLKAEAAINTHIQFISLSRNFGHQNALKAGFLEKSHLKRPK
ncbi:MAG: hypothetical protein B7Z27_06750 [Sphingobacteriia bacterium 32-37-4]|nr:MAG: hypothetical protein B7Z27_06750 [Sphingobacteriia bacterium 32-37-4]